MPITDRELLERLLLPTDDAEGWRRRVAALVRDQAIPFAEGVLDDPQRPSRDREQAATMLGILGGSEAVAPLARALDDPNPVLRARVIEALGAAGDPGDEVVDRTLRALEDPDSYVRETAALTLGRLGVERAVPALREMVEGSAELSIREAASASLRRLGEEV